MALPVEQINNLKMFVMGCKAKPEILHAPELDFYREWLLSLGAKLPPAPAWEAPKPEEKTEEKPSEPSASSSADSQSSPKPAEPEQSSESSDEESDLELNLDFVTGPESESVPTLPNPEKDVTEEESDIASQKRGEAMRAMSDGELEAALKAFTEGIELNPQMAVLYAKRAQLFVRMGRPSAAVQDCDRALELNNNSAVAYKQRGRANRLLGNIDQAYKDLGRGQGIDYDDDTDELQKSLKDDVHKVQEHNNKKVHKEKERELKRRKKEAARRKAENQKAYEEQQRQQRAGFGGFPGGMPGGFPGGMPGGFPGGMPGGMPGMPGGMGGAAGAAGAAGAGGMPGGLGDILSDPELLMAFQDPDVSAAFMEISQNPAAAEKYKDNPKIAKVIDKLKKKFGNTEDIPPETSDTSTPFTDTAGGSGATGPSESSNDLD